MDKSAKPLNCIIVDDEPLAREVIHRYIERVPSLKLVGECSNAIEAMTLLQHHEIDLLFADIQMPEITGTELIKILKNPPRVIITTAFPEYALEGYELDVVDYLLKPVRFERFLKAVNKLFHQSSLPGDAPMPSLEKMENNNTGYLYFRTDRKMVKVMLNDVIYVEGMKNYVKIFTQQGLVITKNSMTAIEAMLPVPLFLRVHRSYIVSKARIKSFTNELIDLNGTEVPIGKLFRNNVVKTLSA